MNEKEIKETYYGKHGRKKYAIIIVIMAVLIASYFMFSPSRQKPAIEKPSLESNVTISESHAEYLANELGVYKLHSSVTGEQPEIELVVGGKIFVVTLNNSRPLAAEGRAKSPDVRMATDMQSIASIFTAKNMTQEIISLYKEGKIGIELLKDEATLFLKGYKDVYDALQG